MLPSRKKCIVIVLLLLQSVKRNLLHDESRSHPC